MSNLILLYIGSLKCSLNTCAFNCAVLPKSPASQPIQKQTVAGCWSAPIGLGVPSADSEAPDPEPSKHATNFVAISRCVVLCRHPHAVSCINIESFVVLEKQFADFQETFCCCIVEGQTSIGSLSTRVSAIIQKYFYTIFPALLASKVKRGTVENVRVVDVLTLYQVSTAMRYSPRKILPSIAWSSIR